MDPDLASALTFRIYKGRRYSLPGDHATVNADGTIRLLGRGSQCINTGGEKVYPDEVEEVIKSMPEVEDAIVLGRPDPMWGQAVTAVVELRPGSTTDASDVIKTCKQMLAGYKCPKRIVLAPVQRLASGKPDLAHANELLERAETTE